MIEDQKQSRHLLAITRLLLLPITNLLDEESLEVDNSLYFSIIISNLSDLWITEDRMTVNTKTWIIIILPEDIFTLWLEPLPSDFANSL